MLYLRGSYIQVHGAYGYGLLRQREELIRFSHSNEDTKDGEEKRAGSPTDD